MTTVLGLHHGHHAACAVVRDGILVAAIEQERVTRFKADGQEGLSNRLPVNECLRAGGSSLAHVDLIVSSFQATGPGSAGLHRPLIEPGFDLFDPFDERHRVVSHHRAHGISALATSGLRESAVLVCDLGGSTTRDGGDFYQSFRSFADACQAPSGPIEVRTECVSIYDADEASFSLKYREYCIPHNTPDVFVHSAASLYDNVSRMVFGKENAHGQLMALAAMAQDTSFEVTAADMVECGADGSVRFRNDWQHRVSRRERVLDYAPLARATQQALQLALMQYARRARASSPSPNLVGAGGVFLNILANTEILESGLFSDYFVPSSPHDAGIAVGCAYAGWRDLARKRAAPVSVCATRAADRLGPRYSPEQADAAIAANAWATYATKEVSPAAAARLLHQGEILARCAGRSEFGPRALGGRSLLASPLLAASKQRLNSIKGRQPWRPVAPIVTRERVAAFFEGPADSPYMTFAHRIIAEHRPALVALSHPDGSTRAQTLEAPDDPYLYAVLEEFARLSGFPILVNTSLNGPGEPIVESPEQALELFNARPDIDGLLLDDLLVRRVPALPCKDVRLAPDAIVSIIYPLGRKRIILVRKGVSLAISQAALDAIDKQHATGPQPSAAQCAVEAELVEALRLGLCSPAA